MTSAEQEIRAAVTQLAAELLRVTREMQDHADKVISLEGEGEFGPGVVAGGNPAAHAD